MVAASFTEFALYRRLLRQARPYWPHLGGLFLLSLLASPLALLTPLPLKMAVDGVVGSHRQIPGPLAALLPAAITAAITIASMIYVTARIDWQLALVALAVSPVLFVVAGAYRHRLRRQWGDAKKLESCAMSVVQEVLAAMHVVKAFGQEDHEQE